MPGPQSFRKVPASRDEDRLEMTPMIDVTFLLLVFFLCTLQFRTLEGRLNAYLPKDEGAQQSLREPQEKLHIAIHVDHPGRVMNAAGTAPYRDPSGQSRKTYEGRQLRYVAGTLEFRSLQGLQSWLASTHRSGRDLPVVLAPSEPTILSDVVPVLDRIVASGFRDVSFAPQAINR